LGPRHGEVRRAHQMLNAALSRRLWSTGRIELGFWHLGFLPPIPDCAVRKIWVSAKIRVLPSGLRPKLQLILK